MLLNRRDGRGEVHSTIPETASLYGGAGVATEERPAGSRRVCIAFQALNRFAKQSVDAHLALGISTILKSSTRVALSVISRVKVLPFLLVCPRILYLNFNIFIFL